MNWLRIIYKRVRSFTDRTLTESFYPLNRAAHTVSRGSNLHAVRPASGCPLSSGAQQLAEVLDRADHLAGVGVLVVIP